MTKPIRIRLTRVSSVMYVNLEPLLKDLYTHSSWEQASQNLLKFLPPRQRRQRVLYIGLWSATLDLHILKRKLFRKMQNVAISQGWTDVKWLSPAAMKVIAGTWQCPDISRMEKLYVPSEPVSNGTDGSTKIQNSKNTLYSWLTSFMTSGRQKRL